MKEYVHKGQKIALVINPDDWKKGLDFLTEDSLFIQVGTWWYNSGKTLQRHIHKKYERIAERTMETIYVVSGSMRVDLYSEERELIDDFVVQAGDFCVLMNGGHGYHILQDDTKILEVKNGPFFSVEDDKIKF